MIGLVLRGPHIDDVGAVDGAEPDPARLAKAKLRGVLSGPDRHQNGEILSKGPCNARPASKPIGIRIDQLLPGLRTFSRLSGGRSMAPRRPASTTMLYVYRPRGIRRVRRHPYLAPSSNAIPFNPYSKVMIGGPAF